MKPNVDLLAMDTETARQAYRWTRLTAELRLLCCGLGCPSRWSLAAVTTFVRLPGDAEYAQAIGTLCRRLAEEYGLEQTVRREGDDWCVCFSRPTSTAPGAPACEAPRSARQARAIVAWTRAAAARLRLAQRGVAAAGGAMHR